MPGLTARGTAYKRAVNGGAAKHVNYRSFTAMKRRCYDKNSNRYQSYGGRGIRVCERWLEPQGFWNFVADMGDKPSRAHSLNRIDNDGDYSPDNCEWATPLQQAANTRRVGRNAGVCFNKRAKLWTARIMVNRVNHHLGYFKTEVEAIEARKDAEAKYAV